MLPNELAFLSMIIKSEGTDHNPRTGALLDPYRTCFNYGHTIVSFADHPAITLEWNGDHMMIGGKPILSTAAGAFQINKPTWLEAKAALQLPDFSPESQQKAALWLIARKGALGAVQAGNLSDAVHLCRNVWASFAGSDSGQPAREFPFLASAFQEHGGALA